MTDAIIQSAARWSNEFLLSTSWDDAKVILPNQVLEVAIVGKQVGLVRVDKPVAYLDIDDTGLVGAGYGPEA